MSDLSGWVVRDATSKDEGYIVPTWIKSLAKGPDAREARGRAAAPSWSDDDFCVYYATMHPIVEGLLRAGLTMRVACIPDRPSAILAWCVVDGGTIYGVGIDRPYKEEFGSELARELLGAEAMLQRRTMRLDIIDIGRPAAWLHEKGWLASLRKASERKLLADALLGPAPTANTNATSRDPIHAAVMNHIHDPKRVPWKPRERRAA